MDENDKKLIMNAVRKGTLRNVQDTLENHNLVLDDSYFDYDILKEALKRKHQGISNYLILKKGCRVRNPNKNHCKEVTPLHLAMELNKLGFIQKILVRGASIYDQNPDGDMPAYAALKKGYFCAIEDLLHYFCRSKTAKPHNKDDILHFHIACVTENLNCVKICLAAGFDVNRPLTLDPGEYMDLNAHIFSNTIWIYNGMSPLHFAATYGFEEMVQLLLENGADINKMDRKGRTPLHSVITGTSELEGYDLEDKDLRADMIKMLLEKKARVDVTDKKKCTPLHLAFYYRNNDNKKNIFELLLSNAHWGPKTTNVTNSQGLSYFHIACTTNDVNQVRYFLDTGVNVNSPVKFGKYGGYTPLHFAVLYNQKKIVEVLLESNAQVNVSTEMKVTPLHLACEYNYEKLQELHSNFEWASQNDKTADVDWTSNCENQLTIIKLLLSHGADIESKDSLGKTPLLHAGMFDFCPNCKMDWSHPFKSILFDELGIRLRKIIGILLYNKANINSRTNKQSSLFHYFSESNCLRISDELIQYLVDEGLEIDATDDNGLTPLHVAVKFDNKQMVQILLKHKANVNAESKSYEIPLQISIKNYLKHSPEKKDIFYILLENASKVNVFNENGKTMLSEAIAEEKIFVVANLLRYGSDINLKDLSGQPSVVSLYRWKKTLSNYKDTQYAKLFSIIYTHIQKLLALGYPVCKKILICSSELYPFYQRALLKSDQLADLGSVYDSCIEELGEMKLVKIDNYTSLYNILLKDWTALAKHVRNNRFIEIVNDEDVEGRFPFYGYLLKIQFRKGLVRNCTIQFAKQSLDRVIGFNLPDSCYELVIKHLSNEEVVNLTVAASIEKSKDDN